MKHQTRLSAIGVLLPGIAWAVAGGCGGKDESVFRTGASKASGTGTTGVTGSATGSTTGGAGSGTISVTGAGGAATGPVDVSPDASCAEQAGDTTAITADIFIMLDKSRSMNCPASDDACENPPTTLTHPSRWEAVTTAINAFVDAPASTGIGVGFGYFPAHGSDVCSVASYATPTVPVSPLPGSAAAISAAIAAITPGGGTPTVPALQGAIDYSTTYTQNTPGRTVAVVFVTDGQPNGCTSTIPAAAMAAATAYAGTPQIKTYVVGLGATASLDVIALAGSGGSTHYFAATGDVAAQLGAALKTISGTVTCDYVIPVGKVDSMKVNISVTPGGGMAQRVGYVMGAGMCAAAGGWYYDNPGMPTKITLCPQTCEPLRMTSGSTVQVLYGCPTMGPAIH